MSNGTRQDNHLQATPICYMCGEEFDSWDCLTAYGDYDICYGCAREIDFYIERQHDSTEYLTQRILCKE